MSKKRVTPTAQSPVAPLTVRLRRLDAVGGFVELPHDHAQRLLQLEAAMNVQNYALDTDTTPDAGHNDDSTAMEG